MIPILEILTYVLRGAADAERLRASDGRGVVRKAGVELPEPVLAQVEETPQCHADDRAGREGDAGEGGRGLPGRSLVSRVGDPDDRLGAGEAVIHGVAGLRLEVQLDLADVGDPGGANGSLEGHDVLEGDIRGVEEGELIRHGPPLVGDVDVEAAAR